MSENNKQIIELNDEELDQVAGGVVRINGNTMRVGFTTSQRIYQLQNCTFAQARNLCEDLLAQYTDEVAHEEACEAALRANGWITDPV